MSNKKLGFKPSLAFIFMTTITIWHKKTIAGIHCEKHVQVKSSKVIIIIIKS